MDLRGFFIAAMCCTLLGPEAQKKERKEERKKRKKSTPTRPDQRQTQYGLKIVLRRKEL